MANDPIIKAEHLTFCYPDEPAGHPPVLDDISLKIEAGSFVAILGHNGSGKSTFAKHINALLTPTAGKLWVDGLDTGDPENLMTCGSTPPTCSPAARSSAWPSRASSP